MYVHIYIYIYHLLRASGLKQNETDESPESATKGTLWSEAALEKGVPCMSTSSYYVAVST